MKRFNDNGTVNINNPEVFKELKDLGYSWCDHFDCGCPLDVWETDDKAMRAYIRKYRPPRKRKIYRKMDHT